MSQVATWNEEARHLLAAMLHNKKCNAFDINLARRPEEVCPLAIAHDRAGAPYVVDTTGVEVSDTLVSFSDERGICACAWAQVTSHSPLVGLGVDLVDASDFHDETRCAFLVRALFLEDEARLARNTHADQVELGYAYAFGAKEATFKATSQPLRTWRQTHGSGMFFEVRDFALAADGTTELGVRRARDVYASLGIDRVELGHVTLGNLVLVVALALGTTPA